MKTSIEITKEVSDRLDEIKQLQDEVERIFISRSSFVKFFTFRKALKIHNLSRKRLIELEYFMLLNDAPISGDNNG